MCPNNLSRRLLQVDQSKNHLQLKGERPSGDCEGPGDAKLQYWRRLWETAQSTAKISTSSRSRSSAKGDECYFKWHETMERRQLESEQQMQALLQEMMRLREENAVLRIQVSSSGPPYDQRPRGQEANSRPDPKSVYPRTTGVVLNMRNERSWERPMPMYHAPQDKSSDSTRLSSKRQRDKIPQLSDSMHARLGPQEAGKERPPVAATWETYPDPPVAPIVHNNPPHQAV